MEVLTEPYIISNQSKILITLIKRLSIYQTVYIEIIKTTQDNRRAKITFPSSQIPEKTVPYPQIPE